jgi:hypothetical protein
VSALHLLLRNSKGKTLPFRLPNCHNTQTFFHWVFILLIHIQIPTNVGALIILHCNFCWTSRKKRSQQYKKCVTGAAKFALILPRTNRTRNGLNPVARRLSCDRKQNEFRYLAPEPLRSLATILVDTGLRLGEGLNLLVSDVHIRPAGGAKYGWVHIRSGKSKNAKRTCL